MTTHATNLPAKTDAAPNRLANQTTERLVIEAVALKLEIAGPTARLKELTEELIARATADTAGQTDTESGGRAWIKSDGRGHSVAVSFPIPERLKIEDPAIIEEIKEITGVAAFRKLFDRTVTYKGVKDFFSVVKALHTPAKAQTIIDLTTKESAARLNFKLGEAA